MDRSERLAALALLATKNNQTPLRNTFVGFIRNFDTIRLGVSDSVAKEDIKLLNRAWRDDRWASLLERANTGASE